MRLFGLILSLCLLAPAAWAKSVALVVGAGAFEGGFLERLNNPVRDARAVADALEGLGFQVIEAIDPDMDAFDDALAEFEQAADGAEIGLIYYAGHGAQHAGQSHLFPIDATPRRISHLARHSVTLRQMLEALEGAQGLRVVILDACRDTGLIDMLRETETASAPASDRTAGARAAALTRGLGRPPATAGDVLIAYAAEPLRTASDGEGEEPHSPYTAALLEHLSDPVETRILFGQVRESVMRKTGYDQRPDLTVRIGARRYYLAGPPPDPVEAAYWAECQADAAFCAAYLRRYPEGANAAAALRGAPERSAAEIAQERYGCDLEDGGRGIAFGERCWPLETTGIGWGNDIPDETHRRITDLSPLAGMTALERLLLSNTQVSDLSPLGGMTTLRELHLSNTQVSDLSPLDEMTALRELSLDNTKVSDISPLGGMTALERLDLGNTQISDLSPLDAMAALERLDLDNTQISDLSPLDGMTALRKLDLSNTQVSDLSPLDGMTALRELYLSNTQVSDLSPLEGMTALWLLFLSNTQVSDLSPLEGMMALESLSLSNTQVSDISPLGGMTTLRELHLSNTQVSDLSPLDEMTTLYLLETPYGRVYGHWLYDTPAARAEVQEAIRTWRPAR